MTSKYFSTLYTLIELVVVIAIIMIMTSLLFTVMEQSRQRVAELGCANNLKGIGQAFSAHAGDYGYLPRAANVVEYNNGEYWFNALAPYMGYNHVRLGVNIVESDFEKDNPLSCVTAVKLYDEGYYDEYGGITKKHNIIGYGMNTWTHLPRLGAGDLPSSPEKKSYANRRNSYKARAGSFRFPSLLPLIGDAREFTLGTPSQHDDEDIRERYQFDRIRHAERANLLLADGRVVGKRENDWKTLMQDFSDDRALFADTETDVTGEKVKSFN